MLTSVASGTCFGYAVTSDVPLAYLRDGDGEPLQVSAGAVPPADERWRLLRTWSPPVVPFRARLYRRGPRYRLWVDGAGWFETDPTASTVTVPRDGDPVRREERLWGLPILLQFLERGDLPLHAAAVDFGGQAVVMGGLGRQGKTTLATACARAGHRVLSEDLTCVRLGDAVTVIPGPAMLRVRHDVADRLVPPAHASELARDAERVHVALDPRTRGDCAPVPLRAVVVMQEGLTQPQTFEIDGPRALHHLWPLSFNLPSSKDRNRSFTQLVELVDRLPVHVLRRQICFEDLPDVVALLGRLAQGLVHA